MIKAKKIFNELNNENIFNCEKLKSGKVYKNVNAQVTDTVSRDANLKEGIIPQEKNDELQVSKIEKVNETNLSQAAGAVINIASRETTMLAINYVSGNPISKSDIKEIALHAGFLGAGVCVQNMLSSPIPGDPTFGFGALPMIFYSFANLLSCSNEFSDYFGLTKFNFGQITDIPIKDDKGKLKKGKELSLIDEVKYKLGIDKERIKNLKVEIKPTTHQIDHKC